MRVRRLLISTLVAGLMLAAAPAATPAGARTNSVNWVSFGISRLKFALSDVTPDTFTVVAQDIEVGQKIEVRASVGTRERVFRGNMARRCVSGAGVGTVKFGCHRAFTLKFGGFGLRKVELVKKDWTGTVLVRTTFFVSDPYRPRFLAKLAVRLCGQRCLEEAEQLAGYDATVGSLGGCSPCCLSLNLPCSTTGGSLQAPFPGTGVFDLVAARQAAAQLYQCTGLSRARVAYAAAIASVPYAATTTRAEYLNAMSSLSQHTGSRIFPADDRDLAHTTEAVCRTCFAKLAGALGEVIIR